MDEEQKKRKKLKRRFGRTDIAGDKNFNNEDTLDDDPIEERRRIFGEES